MERARSRAAAPQRQKEPTEVFRASDPDVYGTGLLKKL